MIKLSDVWSQDRIEAYRADGAKEVICPICKNETMDNWTVCPHCGWEYDHTQRGYSAANRSYKWQYRLQYRIKKLLRLR